MNDNDRREYAAKLIEQLATCFNLDDDEEDQRDYEEDEDGESA